MTGVIRYTAGTANQSDVTTQYTGDGGGSAHLLNSTTATFAEIGNSIGEALVHLLPEALA